MVEINFLAAIEIGMQEIPLHHRATRRFDRSWWI